MTKQTQVRSTEEAPARSALKLALEALNSFPTKHLTPFISSARTAIREALAEPSEALASEASEESSGVAQPTQQKQEPVAKDWRHVIPGRRYTDQGDAARVADYNQGWNDCQKKTKAELDKLYTSPPASNQCKFPLCQNEDYQQALAEQIKQALYTGEPAQRKPLTPEWYAQWIRNNYQDYWNIATLCDEMTKAAHGIKGKNT